MKLGDANVLYFACIDLEERPVIVVGAGRVALEKIEGLLLSGARVRVIAPDAIAEIERFADNGTIERVARRFAPSDLDGAFLVVSATGDRAVAREVHASAEQRQMLVNVADVPELCNFILPAIVRDGRVAIAVSTAGASPALAQRLRREIAQMLKRPYARLADVLQKLRPWAKASLTTYDARKRFFDSIVNADVDVLEQLELEGQVGLQRTIDAAKKRALLDETQRSRSKSAIHGGLAT